MAKNKIDFVANLKVNIESQKAEFDEIEKRVKSIAEGMKFAPKGGQRQKEANEILKDMEKLKSKDTSTMNQRELLNHEKEMFAIKQRYSKLINGIAGAEVAGLATTEEQKKRLEQINTEYANITKTINKYLKKLQDIEDKSGLITKSIKETANLTGISEGTLTNPDGLERAIEARTKIDGTPRQGEEENVKRLLELQKLYNDENFKGLETLEKWNEESKQYLGELEDATDTAGKLRQEKNQIQSEIIKANHASGEISDTEKEILETSKEQLDVEQKTTEEKKKQQGVDSSKNTNQAVSDAKKLAKQNKKTEKSFLGKITAATLYYAALRNLRKIITSVLRVVKELDRSVTEVAMVTNMNREQAWELVDAYQNLAIQVGATTDEIAKLSVFFFRQGRSAKDALELTKVAATAAKVASIDATESANFLTSAINGFGMAASEAMAVSDRFAALGASSASSYQEMAIALSKVAPVAKTAGVGIDFMMGILAKGIETTREAPENIGTAFKTVFARMTQIRDFGATLDDSTGVNKVEEALKQADVALRDSSGNFRDMDVVLTELGIAFDGLTRNQQAYIATALAGTRQQSRLLAVLQNFDRTMELVNVSMTASGATLAQHAMFAGGLQAALARLTASWEKLILAFSDSEVIIDVIDALAGGIDKLANFVERTGKAFYVAAGIMATSFVAAMIISKYTMAALTAGATKLNIALVKTIALKALATGGVSLLVGAAGAAVAGVVVLIANILNAETKAQKLARNSKELTKEIEKNQVALFNFTKQANDLRKMSDRYEDLKNKVVKTSEEMTEMKDLGDKIKDVLEKEHNIVVGADISEDAERVITFIESQAKETLDTSLGWGEIRFEQAVTGDGLDSLEGLTPADFDALKQFAAAKLFGRENFLNATIEEQSKMLDIASRNLNTLIEEEQDFRKAYGDHLGEGINFMAELDSMIANPRGAGVTDQALIASTLANILVSDDYGSLEMGDVEQLLPQLEKIIDEQMDLDGVEKNINHYLQAYKILREEAMEDFLNESMIEDVDIMSFVERFENVLSNSATPEEKSSFWKDFLGLNDRTKAVIANSIEGLSSLTSLGIDNMARILRKDIQKSDGSAMNEEDKTMIALILSNAGLEEKEIVNFFKNIENFTVASIEEFLDTIDDKVQKSQIEADFFDLLTGGATPQKFMNEIEKMKNGVGSLLDLQEKYKTEGLTAEEFGFISDMLGTGDLLDDFFDGTLSAEAFAGAQSERLKNDIVEAMAFTQAKIENLADDVDPGVLKMLENELLMYERLIADMDFMIFNTNMEEFYQSQIDFISELNAKKQEEIDLEQRKLDMNRSMLSLNRQIAALERDTSFGAQARLEDLRLTRSQESAQREAFIMDMVANQQISDLQNQMEANIANNTLRSAEGIEELIALARGQNSDFRTIQAITGTSTNRGGGGRSSIVLAQNPL